MAATANTTIQLAVPDELRGRVMSVYTTVFVGSTPFGGLLMGWIAPASGWTCRSPSEAWRVPAWRVRLCGCGGSRPPVQPNGLPALSPASRSRWTLITSLSVSIRLITLASCETEATWRVAVTTAVWSGVTPTCAARMLTLFSATTWVMSESRPVRSYASTRIAIG